MKVEMKKEIRDYVARLKWVTLREFVNASDKTGLGHSKMFSLVYTLEGIVTISKKEKKRIFKAMVKVIAENPMNFPAYMHRLRQLAFDLAPNKVKEEWNA